MYHHRQSTTLVQQRPQRSLALLDRHAQWQVATMSRRASSESQQKPCRPVVGLRHPQHLDETSTCKIYPKFPELSTTLRFQLASFSIQAGRFENFRMQNRTPNNNQKLVCSGGGGTKAEGSQWSPENAGMVRAEELLSWRMKWSYGE
jgi:hypothetical protein